MSGENLIGWKMVEGIRCRLRMQRDIEFNSAVSHGNSWAMQHYGVTKIRSDDGETVALPGLDAATVYNLQVLAGRKLWLSLGFAVQFMRGHLPAGAMNKMDTLIASIQKAP